MIQKKIKSTSKLAIYHATGTFVNFLAFSFILKDIKKLVESSFFSFLISVIFLFLATALSGYTINRAYEIKGKNKIINKATVIFVLIKFTLFVMLGFLLNNTLGVSTDILFSSSIGLFLLEEIVMSATIFYAASKLFLKESQVQQIQQETLQAV